MCCLLRECIEERTRDWQRGNCCFYLPTSSRDYGCDYLASTAIPYLSTQCKDAALSTVADWRIFVEVEKGGVCYARKVEPERGIEEVPCIR